MRVAPPTNVHADTLVLTMLKPSLEMFGALNPAAGRMSCDQRQKTCTPHEHQSESKYAKVSAGLLCASGTWHHRTRPKGYGHIESALFIIE